MTVLQPPWSVLFVVFLYRSPRKKNQIWFEQTNKLHHTRRPRFPLACGSSWEEPKRREWMSPLGLSPLPPALLPELCCVPANRIPFCKKWKAPVYEEEMKWQFPSMAGNQYKLLSGFSFQRVTATLLQSQAWQIQCLPYNRFIITRYF